MVEKIDEFNRKHRKRRIQDKIQDDPKTIHPSGKQISKATSLGFEDRDDEGAFLAQGGQELPLVGIEEEVSNQYMILTIICSLGQNGQRFESIMVAQCTEKNVGDPVPIGHHGPQKSRQPKANHVVIG
uniref:Uncharacterized protein n=1 Tax=Romanomermis culicivorax TaxID=13658 RepID=A0A915J5K6_ROMCU